LPVKWARVEIQSRHHPHELIGWDLVTVAMCDGSFRGDFSDFLTWLATTSGKAVMGGQLADGTLVSAFSNWLSQRYGGKTFSAAPAGP
jgi:hypothetical protein